MTISSDGSDLIPVRMLTQYAYCKRLAYMEWVQGEFEANADVVDGTYQHRNVDKPSGRKKMERQADGEDHPAEKIHARSVTLSDTDLGIISKTDLLELEGNAATPIEYKRGTTPDNPERTHEDHIIQVCAQGLLLRANGYDCDRGFVYYIGSKQRVEIRLDDQTISKTLEMIQEMRDMAKTNTMPAPLIDSPKCPRCSLVGICLPDETNLLSDHTQQTNKDQIRRMFPIRNDTIPVYVQEQYARISKSGDCIHVKSQDKIVKKIRLMDISEITLLGNIQITTQTIRELCKRNIPICYMTYGGWFVGMTTGLSSKNIELRINQHKAYGSKNASMGIAREIVYGKIKNSITMLRRNHKSAPQDILDKMEEFAKRARIARQMDVLLGLEGIAARTYFSEFAGMIKSESVSFDFNGRNRRPPKDPINAVISFLYALLTKHAMITASRVGLDPYLGFLHMPKYGKPALALDIIEEFRPIIADSTCIRLVNGGEITESDFVSTDFGTSLTNRGRSLVISAYEKRMDSVVAHPILGYSASYKRIMETQTRLLARHLLGEIPKYSAFRTR